MTRRRWVPLLLVAGAAALLQNVVYLSRELSPPSRATGTSEPVGEAGADAGEEPDANELTALRPEQVRAYLAGLSGGPRSPFGDSPEQADRGSPPARAPTLPHLTGTLYSTGRRIAWIDGAPRGEGETVRGYELERIAPGRVVMRRGGELLELPVQALELPERTSEETRHEE